MPRIGDVGRKAEARTFRRVAGSGAWDGDKGDMASADFLLESKATERASYSLKLEVLRKVEREASAVGKVPALAVQFVDATGRPVRGGTWVLLREQDFVAMTSGGDGG